MGKYMSGSAQGRQTPEDIELERKQEELRELETEFAEKELSLATLRAELHHFDMRYIRLVGSLYAVLDDLEARIAEEVARKHLRNERARNVAEQARSKAQKSAFETTQSEEMYVSGDEFKPSEMLKALYRSAAKAIHPDLSSDDADCARRHSAMASVNEAYEKGDEKRIKAIIEEWESSPESVKGEGTAVELVRVIRRISLIRKRLDSIRNEIDQLQSSPLALLKKKVDEGLTQGRDILNEMAVGIQEEIQEAEERLAQIRQSKIVETGDPADADKPRR